MAPEIILFSGKEEYTNKVRSAYLRLYNVKKYFVFFLNLYTYLSKFSETRYILSEPESWIDTYVMEDAHVKTLPKYYVDLAF